jgi:hypothetical protein
MDYLERNRQISAGQELTWTRADQHERHGKSLEEARELWREAAKTAAICGECFRPLAADASVTIGVRQIAGSRRTNNAQWVRVPICLLCTLAEGSRFHATWGYYKPPDWHRARCRNCGRPMRTYGRSLTAETCCKDCARLARNERDKLRRRVVHAPLACAQCGESFIPTRADALTCSNRCRQAWHRARQRQGAVT